MSAKIYRDPLYNYIGIDRGRDPWLLQLLDTPEMQRLRRIHQLGVSYLTYPGADHNRLAHSLGVVHLMQQALHHIETQYPDEHFKRGRAPLLAAAMSHDVGHGPFSHLFEFDPPLIPNHPKNHEVWSRRIILWEDKEARLDKVLREFDGSLPKTVAELIDKKPQGHPSWMKYLLSSQLDMDRLDYLRRDSLFTGAGYGHFDFFRLLNTFEIIEEEDGTRSIVWPEKAKLAIEEYIFSRYYMYQNVYLHKTTRCFEKMIEATWRRAKFLQDNGTDVNLVPAISSFWAAQEPTVEQYLRIEEFTVLQQIQNWTTHSDMALNDLARRFLARKRLAMVDAPPTKNDLAPNFTAWENALLNLVKTKVEYDPPDMYCLKDQVKAKYNQPYFPEKQADEQSVKNAIRLKINGDDKPVEISTLLDRLKALTEEPVDRVRSYIPKELQEHARRI